MATWRKMIERELLAQNETWNDVIANTLEDQELDIEFNSGFGSCEGKPFTLWTRKRVCFPTDYDGSERVASAPRAPCGEPTYHVGGGGSFGSWRDGWDDEDRAEAYAKGWVAIPAQWVKS